MPVTKLPTWTLAVPLLPFSRVSRFASLIEEMDLVVCGWRTCGLRDEASWPEAFLRGRCDYSRS